MSKFQFGVGNERVSDEMGEAINAIAEEHDASFTWAEMPEGWRYWFSAENLGSPFDQATKKAVYEALVAADIELPATLREKVAEV